MISPQGYSLGEEPKSKNPFWGGSGEDSDVNRIYATATVDDQVGTPSVQTTKSIDGHDITFGFNFHNLKGAKGDTGATGATGATGPAGERGPAGEQGPAGERGPAGPTGATGAQGPAGERGPAGANGQDGQDGVSPTVTVSDITGGHRVTITDATGSESFDVLDGEDGQDGAPGAPGQNGQNGQDGVTPDITMSATADATSSASPTVTVTKGGTTANPTFSLAFSGLKGETGATGATGSQGPQGPAGSTGPQGPAGQGVPAGGTAGQVLQKVDGTDYNTEWATPSSGGFTPKVYTYSATITINNYVAALQNNVSSWAMQCDDIYCNSDFYHGEEYLTASQVFDLYKAGKGYLILRGASTPSHGSPLDYNLLCSMYYDGSYHASGCARYVPTDSQSTKQLLFIRTAQ